MRPEGTEGVAIGAVLARKLPVFRCLGYCVLVDYYPYSYLAVCFRLWHACSTLLRFIFDGNEKVELQVVEETATIVLHSKELLIKHVTFTPQGGKPIELIGLAHNLRHHTLAFTFASPLPVGLGELHVVYQGSHNNQMAGFYRSGYTDIAGKSKVMVSTQFESLDARRAFPCWDEPGVKAVFEVTLVIPRALTAFSNMPEVESSEQSGTGKRVLRYAPTPKMSTYLLAFVVGEFDFVQDMTKHGVMVRVYTPPGKAEEGRFGLRVAKDTLDLYDDFFAVPYPLPKLDMVAIPEFAMGAMENWGLVTYREVDILINEHKASSQQKQRVATVVAHELAHQWFGNLVTMQWWDDLWLNEGFASWTENYATDILFPDWLMWEQFTIDAQNAALNLDSLRTSHPIQVPIAHAEEVEQVFDAISYCKGASVVRMLHAVLGPADFKRGLQLYMQRHQYSNTETFDLWNAWEKVSGKPIGQMMASWTEQMGYPIVRVEQADLTDGKAYLTVSQSWFLVEGALSKEEESKLWTVPLLYGTAASVNGSTGVRPDLQILTFKTDTIEVPLRGPNDWVKLNLGQHAPLRVLYPPVLLARLAAGVRDKTLPATDRAGLLMDCFNLTKKGEIPATQLLTLIKAYEQEDNSTVWEALAQVLTALDKLLIQAPEIRKRFGHFASSLVKPAALKVGWDPRSDDGHLGKLLRATLINLLSLFCWSEPEVLGEARRRFEAILLNPLDVATLPTEYKVPVLSMVLKAGHQYEFDQVMRLYRDAPSNVEKKQVYNAIGATSDPKLKRRVLDWALQDIKLQDFFYPIGSVSSSSHEGLELAWDFFKLNLPQLKAKLATASSSLMDAVIVYSCGSFSTAEKADEIETFFRENPLPSSQRKIAQTLERIRINARFLDRLRSEIGNSAFWKKLAGEV